MYNLYFEQKRGLRVPKPDRSALLNPRHPLTEGLAFYTNCSGNSTKAGSAVSGLYESISRTIKFPISLAAVTTGGFYDLGPSLSFNGSNNPFLWNLGNTNPITIPAMVPVHTVDSPFTVAVKFRTTTAPAAIAWMFGFPSSVTNRWVIGLNITTGAALFRILNTTDSLTTGTWIDGNWYTAIATHQPAGNQILSIYGIDGVLREQVTTATASYTTGTGADLQMGGNGAGSANLFTGQMEWVGCWANRVLTDVEQQSIAFDPYQIFDAPQMRRRWQFAAPAAAAGGFQPAWAAARSQVIQGPWVA